MTDCCGLFWMLSEAAKTERIAFAPIGLPPLLDFQVHFEVASIGAHRFSTAIIAHPSTY
jgi:hypothetical protein